MSQSRAKEFTDRQTYGRMERAKFIGHSHIEEGVQKYYQISKTNFEKSFE